MNYRDAFNRCLIHHEFFHRFFTCCSGAIVQSRQSSTGRVINFLPEVWIVETQVCCRLKKELHDRELREPCQISLSWRMLNCCLFGTAPGGSYGIEFPRCCFPGIPALPRHCCPPSEKPLSSVNLQFRPLMVCLRRVQTCLNHHPSGDGLAVLTILLRPYSRRNPWRQLQKVLRLWQTLQRAMTTVKLPPVPYGDLPVRIELSFVLCVIAGVTNAPSYTEADERLAWLLEPDSQKKSKAAGKSGGRLSPVLLCSVIVMIMMICISHGCWSCVVLRLILFFLARRSDGEAEDVETMAPEEEELLKYERKIMSKFAERGEGRILLNDSLDAVFSDSMSEEEDEEEDEEESRYKKKKGGGGAVDWSSSISSRTKRKPPRGATTAAKSLQSPAAEGAEARAETKKPKKARTPGAEARRKRPAKIG
eukprot:284818281_5